MNDYSISALVLRDVVRGGRSLDKCLEKKAPIVSQICFGSLRNYFLYSKIIEKLLQKPINKKHSDLFNLLIAGLYSLDNLKKPSHACVNESVEASAFLGKSWAKNLINAVLRNYLRKKDSLIEAVSQASLEVETNHPEWLVALLKKDWDNWRDLINANNKKGPMTLRVNRQRIKRLDYQKMLEAAQIQSENGLFCEDALTLKEARDVETLPGFSDGLVSVQDEGAQIAVRFMNLLPGLKILDACAAPGGKTCHILETNPDSELFAVDKSQERLGLLHDNLKRLSLNAKVINSQLEDFGPMQKFDRILLDAPCSATGVIRRHPDIKLLRKPDDIGKLTMQQEKLIEHSFNLLAEGGELLYATCSVLRMENDSIVKKFISRNSDAGIKKIDLLDKVGKLNFARTKLGVQLFPTPEYHDGFYYSSILRKHR